MKNSDQKTQNIPDVSIERNNSGRGVVRDIPDGIEGWSLGAFLLSGIWAIANRTWIGLLSFVPFLGIVMILMLAKNGRVWAWQNVRWESVEHFNRVQKRWSILGCVVFLIPATWFLFFLSDDLKVKKEIEAERIGILAAHKVIPEITQKIGEFVLSYKRLPRDINEAGYKKPIPPEFSNISIDPNSGFLVVSLRTKRAYQMKYLVAPSFEGSKTIVWRCLKGDVQDEYLPSNCRFDSADQFQIP